MSIIEVRTINNATGTIGVTIPTKTAKALGIVPGTQLWIDWADIQQKTQEILTRKDDTHPLSTDNGSEGE